MRWLTSERPPVDPEAEQVDADQRHDDHGEAGDGELRRPAAAPAGRHAALEQHHVERPDEERREYLGIAQPEALSPGLVRPHDASDDAERQQDQAPLETRVAHLIEPLERGKMAQHAAPAVRLQPALLDQVEHARAARDGEHRVAQKCQQHVHRQPYALEDGRQRLRATLQHARERGEAEDQRHHDGAEREERAAQLDGEEEHHQQHGEERQPLAEVGHRQIADEDGADDDRGHVQDEPRAHQPEEETAREVTTDRDAGERRHGGGEVEPGGSAQQDELHNADPSTPRCSSVHPSPPMPASRRSTAARSPSRSRSSSGESSSAARTAARSRPTGSARRTPPRMATSAPYSGPTRWAISLRNRAARAGLAPPVPTATCSSPRASTAGARKSHAAGTSITFRSTRSRAASSRRARMRSGSRTEAYASIAPRRSPAMWSRGTQRIAPVAASSRSAGVGSSAISVTVAPASRQARTLPSIAWSPPTATQERPSRHRNTGWVRMCAAMLPEATWPRNSRARGGGQVSRGIRRTCPRRTWLRALRPFAVQSASTLMPYCSAMPVSV